LATLHTSKRALAAGDAELLRHCYYTADPDEQQAIDAIVDTWAAQARFHRVCTARFGADAGGRADPGFNLHVPPDAREQIDGNTATLHNVGGAVPARLERIDGRWRFTYGSLVENNFRDLPRLAPADLVQVFRALVTPYAETADEVQAGTHERIEAALNVQDERRRQAYESIQHIIRR
jgi:hypothetical protein